jgi:hypothetical protein
MSATNNTIPANHNQEILLVGGPKDGQWIPPLGESVGDRVFFPVAGNAAADLMSDVPGPSPAYVNPPVYGHVSYDRIELQLTTARGRSRIAQILHNEGESGQRFDATEFLQKLLESYGEPKARWRKPTPEDGGFGRYYFVKEEVDEYTKHDWHSPINIHFDKSGRWFTCIPRRNQPIRQYYFNESMLVCECVRPPKEDKKEPKE